MTRITNYVDDIEGTKPCLKPYTYSHKTPTAFVDGSTSRRLHPDTWNKGQNPQFMQLPIEGSSPSHTGFTTTRVVNPLTPSYKLPYCEPAPLVQPKFLRDSYQTNDIEGTHPKPRNTKAPRDTMNLDDITGASAQYRPRGVKTSKEKDIMSVADIIHPGFRSSRVTDPLRPVHVVNGFRSADDPLSYSKTPYESMNHPFYPLQTRDIQGASTADSLKGVVGNIPHVKRRHFRSTNNVQDIRGAQANTVHHSIVSNRQVDPIFPDYTDLDGDILETGLPIPKNVQFPDVGPRVTEKKYNNVSTIQLGMKPAKDQQKKTPVVLSSKQVAARKADIDAIAFNMAPVKLTTRLEQQARDPIDVIRTRLKDVSETTVLNTQQLLEIKADYLHRAESTKNQLDGFVQAQIDEIERASNLLSFDDSVAKVSHSLKNMGTSCHRMREELGDEGVASEVSIARRNLKDLQFQMQFYDELPRRLAELERTLQGNLGELLPVFTKYLAMDEWRQKMLVQLEISGKDNQDEILNSKHTSKALAAILPRLNDIDHLGQRILDGTWSIIINCIEMVQFDRKRLLDAFQIVEHLEKRKRKRIDTNKIYLDHSLHPINEAQLPSMFQLCRVQLQNSLKARVAELFTRPQDQEFAQAFNGMLNNASGLLLDLEYVEREVASCFPSSIDALQIFVHSYNTALEEQFAAICGKDELGVAQKLQLVQWIDYYNSQIGMYRSGTVSDVLEQNANLLMKLYLDGIQEQIQTWITNIYNREEETIVGPNGELHSTRPNDIMNILSSQISIAQEWLSGSLLSRVVLACLNSLMKQLETRLKFLTTSFRSTDIESLCSFVNDTDVLQSKCMELIDKIEFRGVPDQEEELTKLRSGLGDTLDTTSSDIVKLAVNGCGLIVDKIFDEIEGDTTIHWFTRKWEEQDPVVANLLATLEDYYHDLKAWISGSFFFAKVVRQALDCCIDEYIKRFLQRMTPFANADAAYRLIDIDIKNFHQYFMNFESELRRGGLRSSEDLMVYMDQMKVLSSILSRKISVEDLKRELHELEQSGILDETTGKRVERYKALIAASKRFVPVSSQDGNKGKKSENKPTKKTFFKKSKGEQDAAKPGQEVAKPGQDAVKPGQEVAKPGQEEELNENGEFQVKTTSLDAFLNY